MNNQHHPPPAAQRITINDILNIRLALEQITNPSDKIFEAKANLDEHIRLYTTLLKTGEPSNG